MKKCLGILFFYLLISGTCYADDFFNPPPLNNPEMPPWMQNSNQGNQPPPNNQNPPPQQGQPQEATPAPPVDTTAPDTSSDDEENASPFDFESGSSDNGPPRDQGKNSFQVLDQNANSPQECIGWGNAFLGTKVFPNQTACRNELEQEIENARDTVNNYADSTEKEVLRGVIKGKISREKSKDFHMEFSSIKGTLTGAAKTGCSCLE